MLFRRLTVAATVCLAAGCTQPTPEPTPPPVSTPAPSPAPSPPPTVTQPSYDNWMDAPATPGDWTLRTDSAGTVALFGEPQTDARFSMRCNASNRTVTIMRAGTGTGEVPMRIRTETLDRMLTANAMNTQLPVLSASLPARDPLLAAMALSKGRFAVETQGLPTLYIPAWPEMTRVIEDCL